jgi:dTDP-4-dehydrorhamnose reductase
MNERILVLGNGWLGNRLASHLGAVMGNADITDRGSVAEAIEKERPSIVVNAAGKTGRPNVDSCEDDPVGTVVANVAGPIILARECLSRSIYMVHLGSGCVYDGRRPDNDGWHEEDEPNFKGSLYSRSKACAEGALRDVPILQLRLRMPFDGTPHPRNLITKLTRYKRVVSVPNSMTCVDDFLAVASRLMERRKTGIWNVVNPGALTHPEILDLYREIVEPGHRYEIMPLEELQRTVRVGRSHCVLSTAKLEREGIILHPIGVALRDALSQYKERKGKE